MEEREETWIPNYDVPDVVVMGRKEWVAECQWALLPHQQQ
jgi:hypothetical protein